MHGALVELVLLQARGRIVRRVRLLRQPRYLLAFLVGLAYFGFVLGPKVFSAGGFAVRTSVSPGEHEQALNLAAALALATAVTLAWLLASSQPALRLNETELEFLLPAPLPRRQIVLYSLLGQQPGVLTSALVIFFVRGARWSGTSLIGLAGLWALLTLADLHLKGISLWKARLNEIPPAASRLRRGAALAVGAAWWIPLVASLAAAWRSVATALPGGIHDSDAFVTSFARQVEDGTAGFLLAPFAGLSSPLRAQGMAGMSGTVGGVAAVLVLAVLIALHVEWVVRSRVSFEEATLERARRESARKGVSRRELQARRARHREPFRLAAEGPPEAAILWKNLMLRGRTPLRSLAVIIAAVSFAGCLAAVFLPFPVATALTVAGLLLLCGIPFASGLLLRNDLRTDLLRADILRTWPISGASLVRAEIMAPATNALFVMILGCGLTAAGVLGRALSHGDDYVGVLPASITGSHPVLVMALVLVSVLLAGLGLVALSLAIQNLAVLLLPGWVGLGLSRGRGTAILGQRLLLSLGHLLAVVVAALPSAVVIGLVIALHAFRAIPFSVWELPVLAAVTAFFFLAEAGLLIRIAGGVWDRLDISKDILTTAEGE